jgi:asparagine synthase (glutamine-hydrolysing)
MSSPITDLELACGVVFGVDRRLAPLPAIPATLTPLKAIEAALLPALRRAPCLVSFSGGRDSAAALAVAARLARREGLPDPIPATNRFTGVPTSDEDEWQELLIAHLGIKDWLRLDFTDELDVVGPYAQRALRRHGLLWPCNAHFHLPLLEAAEGGALITGAGGDELFMATTRRRAYAVLAGLERPRRRDVLTIGLAVAPRPVRRAVHARRITVPFGWLRPTARRALVRTIAMEDAREPIAPTARLRFLHGSRSLRVAIAALGVLAGDHDVLIAHPLAAPEVAAAVARRAPKGFSGRAEGMGALLGEVLPQAVVTRSTKATFDQAFFHDHSRAFAAAWQGDGVPAEIVDVEALSRDWLSAAPTPQSMTLLQAAWLARDASERSGDGIEKPFDGLAERVPAARPA